MKAVPPIMKRAWVIAVLFGTKAALKVATGAEVDMFTPLIVFLTDRLYGFESALWV
jgi:hypothetical protein